MSAKNLEARHTININMKKPSIKIGGFFLYISLAVNCIKDIINKCRMIKEK